jgi:hypothetical protein
MSILSASTIKKVLDPVERLSEILVGIITTLSISGTMSVVAEGTQDIRTMLLSILGCNIAGGIIDATIYLLGLVADRGREHEVRELVRNTRNPQVVRAALDEELPPDIADDLRPKDIAAIQDRLVRIPEAAERSVMQWEDFWGAVGVFLIVVLSCVPLIIPFFFMSDPLSALRVSNVVAILMLFFVGYYFARYAGYAKIKAGFIMVVLGAAMVGTTIALGG